MKKEPQQNIDSFFPEGWEFREEYMEQALAALHRQRLWMKWKKIGLWTAAAAVAITIGATFLHVCSSPDVLEANRSTSPNQEESFDRQNATSASASSTASWADTAKTTEAAANSNPLSANTDHTPSSSADLPKAAATAEHSRPSLPTSKDRTSKRSASKQNPSSAPSITSTDAIAHAAKTNTVMPHLPTANPISPTLPAATAPTSANAAPTHSSTVAPQHTLSNDIGHVDVLSNASSPQPEQFNAAEKLESRPGLLARPEALMLTSSRIGTGSKHAWMLFAGNAMWADYGKTSNALAWQPIAGIAHRYRLRGPYSLQSQLAYSAIQDPGAVYRRLQVIYDYEQLQSTTQVATKRLHYITMYSGIHRRFSSVWSAFCGIGAGLKITGNNTITRTDVNNVTTSNEATGYVRGFQRLNLGLNLGVEHALTPQLGIGLQGIIGLTDVSDDALFNEQKHQSNSQLNLILSYRFQ